MTTQQEILDASKQLLIPNYGDRMLVIARGAGAKVWDADGKEYIDFFAGFGGGGVTGHCHPKIVEALQSQAQTLLSHGNFFTNTNEVELAKGITTHAFGGKVFFCHSGGEANECAIKLVRLAGGKGRYKIISFTNCFHGRTMGGLSLTPAPKQAGFEPMLPGNVMVPFGDLAATEAAVDDETAAIFVEPIQGEGGVNVPAEEFMQALRTLCDQKNLLL
ncbi:MAG: aspartate aminotransferase family protein, partial [Planctomycetota bacterium]